VYPATNVRTNRRRIYRYQPMKPPTDARPFSAAAPEPGSPTPEMLYDWPTDPLNLLTRTQRLFAPLPDSSDKDLAINYCSPVSQRET
jgi:hypothetical protein